MTKFVRHTEAFNRQLVDTVRTVRRQRRSESARMPSKKAVAVNRATVQLLEALAAATDAMAAPETALATLLTRKTDETLVARKTAEDDDITVTVCNRSAASFAIGDVIDVVRKHGQWYVIAGGTGASGGGGCSCCCKSATLADAWLTDGTPVTIWMELCSQLQPITESQTHGELTITFPTPGNMRLQKDENSDLWSYELSGSAFTAIYWNKTSATGDLVAPTGSVIFEPSVAALCGSCPEMRLRIEWDADIPDPGAS